MPDPAPETPRTCSRCGAELPTGASECPRCMLRLGLRETPPTESRVVSPSQSAEGPTIESGPTAEPTSNGERENLSRTPPTLEEVRAAFPDLEIVELLGRGGMGTVFKARQKKLERTVALKVLPRGLGSDPAFAERFLREARALARLSHPGIVTVHDFGCADGLFFLLMEYVDGLDLRRLLRQGPMETRQALAIARDLCDALQYAHDEGVVHRDIKPENVLLDAKGRVKIADFGLAKLVHPAADAFLSRTDQVMGTPHYMAPEQLERPREVDHRADIFALGVVLYEMLTGSLPRGNFELPSRRVHVDVRLDEIVLKALAREPERRYQQALEVKTDVDLVSVGSAVGPELARKGGSVAPEAAPRPRKLPTAKKDWFRGPRALALLVAMWIAVAALWNLGLFPHGLSVPVAILVLGGLLWSRVRADPELSAAIGDQPRSRRALLAGIAVIAVVAGLLAISAGHVLHWEQGTEHWKPSSSGLLSWFEEWRKDPSSLLIMSGAPLFPFQPALSMEKSFTQSSADASSLSPWLLIGLGVVLLAIGISSAVHVRGPDELRRRSLNLGMEISSYALGALLLLWVGAPIAALRGEIAYEGIEQRVDSALSFDDAATKLYTAFLEEGFQVDVEQHLRVSDTHPGNSPARVRIYRAQAESPFIRWSTSFRGPVRKTPQIWATLVEHTMAEGSTVVLRGGLYDTTSDELARARDEVSRIQRALLKL